LSISVLLWNPSWGHPVIRLDYFPSSGSATGHSVTWSSDHPVTWSSGSITGHTAS